MSSSNPSSASFETSFDNDVAFKSLIESSNNNDKSTNISNTDYQSALQSDDDQDQQQKQDSHPEDLNLFISDLLEQMVSFILVPKAIRCFKILLLHGEIINENAIKQSFFKNNVRYRIQENWNTGNCNKLHKKITCHFGTDDRLTMLRIVFFITRFCCDTASHVLPFSTLFFC